MRESVAGFTCGPIDATNMAFRILHVIASVNPKGGGPIEGLTQLARVNGRVGHHIEVASLDDPQAAWVKNCPLPCHAMGPTHLHRYQFTPRLVPWLRAHRQDYDAVIVNGIWQYHAFGVWRALSGTDTPYFVYPHGMLDPWFKRHYRLKHLRKCLFWPWGDYRVLRDAAAVLFTSEEEARLAPQSFPLRCTPHVVRYGTSTPAGAVERERATFLAKFPQLAHTRNLVFLGRMHEKKGVDILLRAWAALRSEHPNWFDNTRLVMAGPADDDFGVHVQALSGQLGLAEQVVWTGMVRDDLKWGAFRSSDAFVLPSHQENFGIAVAEALACGLPVLISNQVNIWREIDRYRAGWIDDDTLEGTQRLIRRWLLTSQEERDAMRGRAIDCFQQEFHIERAADSLISAIRRYGRPDAAAGLTLA